MLKIVNLRFGADENEPGLSFEPGPMTVFVGPNNSGKSLALRELESFIESGGDDLGWIIESVEPDLPAPEVVREMVACWLEGYEVVYGVRTDREGETRFKLLTARLFYRLINWLSDTEMPLDTGDYPLLDRRVVDAIVSMPERDRFVRGMVSWVGYRQIGVPYRRAARFAGETKYPVSKMLRFAVDGILSLSIKPLRLSTLMGFASAELALLAIGYAFVMRVFTQRWVAGWTALIIAILFLGGAQLISLGVVGEYVGRLYGEAKRRPLYLVREALPAAPRLEPAVERRPSRDRRSWRERRHERTPWANGQRPRHQA